MPALHVRRKTVILSVKVGSCLNREGVILFRFLISGNDCEEL